MVIDTSQIITGEKIQSIADIYIDDKSINPFLHNISYFGFFNNFLSFK